MSVRSTPLVHADVDVPAVVEEEDLSNAQDDWVPSLPKSVSNASLEGADLYSDDDEDDESESAEPETETPLLSRITRPNRGVPSNHMANMLMVISDTDPRTHKQAMKQIVKGK